MMIKFDKVKFNKGVFWFGVAVGSTVKKEKPELAIQFDLFKWAFIVRFIRESK